MRLGQLWAALLATGALAHSQNDINLEDTDLSLPELATLNALDPPKWEILGNAEFSEGRIIMTPRENTVGILKNPIPVAYDSWTIEVIFRATGAVGKTGGAFALKYVNDVSDNVYDSFDGLEVVVDSDSKLGGSVHAYLNDASINLADLQGEDRYAEAFGSCLLSYQDASVPNTLRVSYYAGKLVVQINNRACVKTEKVKLPTNYKIGVIALTGEAQEQFEVLKLKTYGGVISEILENDEFPAAQPKYVTEFVKINSQGEVIEKSQVEDKEQVPVSEDHAASSSILEVVDKLQKTNKDILEGFHTLESKLVAISATSGSSNGDFSYVEEQNKKLKQLSSGLSALNDQLTALGGQFTTLEKYVNQEVGKAVGAVNKHNADTVNQLRENEHAIEQLTKKIEYLVLSEKDREQNPVHDVINGLKYLILPVLMTSLVLCFFAYRLRHDIKTKLL